MEEQLKHDKPENIVRLALERFKKSADAESSDRALAIEDLRFIDLGEQWDPVIEQDRKEVNRPCLTENRLPTFVAQVIGDQRQNRPRIKVRPVDSKSDPAVASVFTGLIRNIENVSQAGSVRDNAFEQALKSGWGYYGIHTRYADEESFNQEIYYRYIPNQFSVYDDPNAKLPDRSDRKFLIVTDTMSPEEFKAKYPKAKTEGFDQAQGDREWFTKDEVRVGEYWYIKPEKVKIALLSNGEVVKAGEFEEGQIDEATGEPVTILKERTTTVNKVYSCIISGAEVLEGPTLWPGKYIPFMYVCGQEANIEGRRVRRGLVRWAKDPQRMHNYWLTTITETVALQPKAPFLVTPQQVENHESMWARANTANLPYLLYNNDGAPIPQRQTPNMLPQGSFAMMQHSIDGMKATMGMYDASLGNQSNETSGKAIIARQRESDVSTFSYIDNLTRAISFEGRVLVDLIPKIYDTADVVRIINPDESEKFVMINQALTGENVRRFGVEKSAEGTIYDLSAGKYDVVVETGPSYSTQRAEASDSMTAAIQAAPKILDVAGDIYFKNQDWPGSQEIAERLRKTLPPGLAKPEEGEEPPPPPPPDPKVEIEKAKVELDFAKLEVEKMKLMKEAEDADTKTKRIVLDTLSEVFTHPGQAGQMNQMGGGMV